MKITCALFLVPMLLMACAQTENTSYPISSKYTLESAYKKLSKRNTQTQWPASVEGVAVARDQIYKKIGARWLKADVYKPEGQKEPLPGIILVHGGGWSTGDRTMWSALAERLAVKDYVAITVSYRLSPESQYPAAVHDIRDSVRWLRKNAARYNVDPTRIVLAGGSAGGQLASLVGLTSGNSVLDKYAKKSPELGKVSAVINIDGLSSFVVPMALQFENDPNKKPSAAGAWFGGSYREVPELWEQASPLHYVSNTTPPMLFIKSGVARFTAGIELMETKLRVMGIPYRIESFPEAPHSFWLFDPWVSPTADKIEAFLSTVILN